MREREWREMLWLAPALWLGLVSLLLLAFAACAKKKPQSAKESSTRTLRQAKEQPPAKAEPAPVATNAPYPVEDDFPATDGTGVGFEESAKEPPAKETAFSVRTARDVRSRVAARSECRTQAQTRMEPPTASKKQFDFSAITAPTKANSMAFEKKTAPQGSENERYMCLGVLDRVAADVPDVASKMVQGGGGNEGRPLDAAKRQQSCVTSKASQEDVEERIVLDQSRTLEPGE